MNKAQEVFDRTWAREGARGTWISVQRLVESCAHRVRTHRSLVRLQHFQSNVGVSGGEPCRVIFRTEYHRHSVVKVREELIRCGCQDRAALQNRSIRIEPSVPKACECEHFSLAHLKTVGLLCLAVSRPLVESIARNQTTL